MPSMCPPLQDGNKDALYNFFVSVSLILHNNIVHCS